MSDDQSIVPMTSEMEAMTSHYVEAFEAHRRMYALRFPPPIKQAAQRTDRITAIALVVMVIASIIVSGSRTIIEFGGGNLWVGIPAFLMLECGMIAYAYIRTKKHYDKTRHESIKRWITGGMWLAFAVTLGANLHATLKAAEVFIPEWVNTAIYILLAVSAPTLALIAGDVLGMESVRNAHGDKEAEQVYRAEYVQWQEGLNASWNEQKRHMGVSIRVSKPVSGNSTGIPVENESRQLSNGNSNSFPLEASESTLGHRKAPNARSLAEEWFNGYTGDVFSIDAESVYRELGIGKSTFYKVWGERKAQQGEQNHG